MTEWLWKERIPKILEMMKQWLSKNKIAAALWTDPKMIWTIMQRPEYAEAERAYVDTFTSELKSNNFSPNWEYWWLKWEKASIFIRNNKEVVRYEDVRDEIIEQMKEYAPKYQPIERTTIRDWHLLVLDPADIHIGKLSDPSQTNSEYTIDIAVQRVLDWVEGIIQKATNAYPIDKIVLILGNDILHRDNPRNTTTSGTFQDTDWSWTKAFYAAKKLYIDIIERLLTIADVHCVYNCSNHDYQSGFMLVDSVSSWFHNATNVTFDASVFHRKYFQYGNSLIGTSHWDGAKESNLWELMATEAREMWATSKRAYWYLHHVHHKRTHDKIGYTVEYLRTPSAPDRWHSDNGYVWAPQAIEWFIHDKTNWQVCRLTHFF